MSDRKCTNPKDQVGSTKLPLNLVPDTLTLYAATSFAEGASKYGAFNWRAAGVRASIYRAALDRHLKKWWNGEDRDQKTGVHHLASVLACAGIILDAEACGKLTDDRPPAVELAGLIEELEEAVRHVYGMHAHLAPHHYTIADTPAQAVEEPAANDEGWTRWHGCGFPPVEEERMVTVRRRDGIEARGPAVNFVWDMVAAYKVEAA